MILDHNSTDDIVAAIKSRYPYMCVTILGPCLINVGIKNDEEFSMRVRYGNYGIGKNWIVDDDFVTFTTDIDSLVKSVGTVLDGWAITLRFKQEKILESLRSIERLETNASKPQTSDR